MSTKMLLTPKLDQRLVMNQQLRQAITLLQYNTLDLKQLVQQYIENNPLIEVEENEKADDTKSVNLEFSQFTANVYKSKQYHEDENSIDNFSIRKTLRDHLLEQTLLCQFDPIQQIIAETIIDAIDEKGRLTMGVSDIQQTLLDQGPPSISLINEVLMKIQVLDPVGVGASDLRECLLIQLRTQEQTRVHQVAMEILNQHFDALAHHHSKTIIKQLGLTQVDYTSAMSLIRSLNPNPGLNFYNDLELNAEPELYVKKIKNKWTVFLTESILTQIKINKEYKDLIKKSRHKNQPNDAIQEIVQEAQWLYSGIKRRNQTLLIVASRIMELQMDFLEKGPAFMKPLNIADVAQSLELHESTVSRITTEKYIATPKGIFELKYFFPSQVLTESGTGCSAIAVKELIKEILDQEKDGQVLSDGDIAALLKEKGINIARRTVAKYREGMKILSSYQRSQMKSGIV